MKTLLLPVLLLACSVAGPFSAYSAERARPYTLDVSFDIPASLIKGVAKIAVARGEHLKLYKGKLRLIHVSLNGADVPYSGEGESINISPAREGTLEIRYEGVFRMDRNGQPDNVIDGRGIFLTGPWYPKPDEMCVYGLTITLPAGFEAVSEAETIEKTVKDGNARFACAFPHPVTGINFMATDRYRVARESFQGVEVFGYFFAEDRDLAKTYLEHAKHYLALYGDLIGPFPYKRFSIVENFLPTGYSMPTYTVLGQQVVRLPFIPETSLGHEILHQWLGNLVYIDYQEGNWAEGLTTFLADHLYEEEKGRGWHYRKGALSNYMSYVNDGNEFPLKAFTERTDNASQAIGYGKAVMVFQMLRDLVGRERFSRSVKYFVEEMRFKRASWSDIEKAFERGYQGDLGWFFTQWIGRIGLADLRLGKAEVKVSGSKFLVSFEVSQGREPLVLDIPVTVYSREGKTRRVFHLSGEKGRFETVVDGAPERLVVDEDYEVARMLSPAEFPPVIARLLGDKNLTVVLPDAHGEVYREVLAAFKGAGDKVVTLGPGSTLDELRDRSFVVLGADNPITGKVFGKVTGVGGFSVEVRNNPWNPRKVAAVIDSRSADETGEAFPKVLHYGNYSYLSFDHGTVRAKKTDESSRGIDQPLLKETVAVNIAALKTLPDVIQRVADKKIIYVGEAHDRFSHHVTELEIIKDLHGRGKKIAIGMEMFERTFQHVLNAYIEAGIDEKALLRGTEYFKRWGFDYALYRPILLFARSEGIPVIALNQKKELVNKVFHSGLDSLSGEEKKLVPSQMDFSDNAYRERLRAAFQEHESAGKRDFDFFNQAQILWDETMADSIAGFLEKHPDHQMVVLAGSGHLQYGSGIPKRAAERTGGDYAIVLNDMDPGPGIADFVLYPDTFPEEVSPRLMVLLADDGGRVEITGFPRNSVSQKEGMRKGDILLAIDGSPVHTVDDLKIDLLYRKKGDKVKVTVERKAFFGGGEKYFEIILQ